MRALALLGALSFLGAAISGCSGEDLSVDNTGGGGSGTGTGGAATGGAGTGGAGTGGQQSSAGGNGTGGAAECVLASDCAGTPACGVWACTTGQCQASAANCVDADFDGYGSGASCACAGLDCDDADDTIADSVIAGSCYSGPANTSGVGTCVAGTNSCSAGVWTPCSGEVTPSGEGCNAQDDDCNGQSDDGLGNFTCGLGACANSVMACNSGVAGICAPLTPAGSETCGDNIDNNCNGVVDEGCSTNCVPVAPNGNDTTAGALTTPNLAIPFATIQAAIAWTVLNAPGKAVCVAGGIACGNTATYPSSVTMANGVSVLGSYESTTWTQCAAVTTTITPQSPVGVSFPSTVQAATTLDHFTINRFTAAATAAVTVDAAINVTLSNLIITANGSNPNINLTRGINVVNGGEATIVRSHVEAGIGTAEAIAVRAVGSEVHLLNNCDTINAFQRCGNPFASSTSPGLRHGNGGAGETYGVYLEDSPNSTIQTTGIVMGNATQGAGIKITGEAAGVLLRGNNIFAFDGVLDSHGVWLEDCNGDAPWIVNNEMISGNGANATSRADGVRSIGDCHPVIDSNIRLQGGGEGNAANPNGVHCGANTALVASKCAVLNNVNITGAQGGFPPTVTGVRCDGGSCLRVAGNVITARGAATGYGVFLENTGAMVDDNEIRGGCSGIAYGVYSKDSYARLQNNRIFGYTSSDCPGSSVASTQSTGLGVEIAAGLNEVDVHSNDIDGGTNGTACNSRGVWLVEGTPAPTAGSGVFRNNSVRSGACSAARYGVQEATINAEPRIFENNNLDPFTTPTALYFDEGTTPVTTAMAVNMLTGMTVAGTISGDSLYTTYPTDLHLLSGSPCIGMGTATGAPAFDMDGIARTAPFDIGADQN